MKRTISARPVIPVILLLSLITVSCQTIPLRGKVEGGLIEPPEFPVSFSVAPVFLEDRSGLPRENEFADHYAATLLRREGWEVAEKGIYYLEIRIRESKIENDMRGMVSVSGMLSAVRKGYGTVAQIVYIGYSREGLDSDAVLFSVMERLIQKLSRELLTYEKKKDKK